MFLCCKDTKTASGFIIKISHFRDFLKTADFQRSFHLLFSDFKVVAILEKQKNE